MRNIQAEIEDINEIVSWPTVLAQVIGEIEKDEAAASEIIKLVESDPGLTASILRAVNSPFYGLRWRVTNVSSSIALLGLSETARLLLAMYLKQKLFGLKPGLQREFETLWRHSITTATITRLVAHEFGLNFSGSEFTAGLLHDIGKIVLLQYYPSEIRVINRMVREPEQQDVQIESLVVGVPHTDIGAILAERWRLPKDYVEVIKRHHTPALAELNPRLCYVVRLADILATAWTSEQQEQPEWIGVAISECFAGLTNNVESHKEKNMGEFVINLTNSYTREKEFVSLF